MNLPQNNKPTLKELFESKKLDQPSGEFWDDFQDQVRSKTLSSVVTEKSRISVNRFIRNTSYFLILGAISYLGFYGFSDNSFEEVSKKDSSSSTPISSSSNVISTDLDLEDAIIDDLNLFSSVETGSNFRYEHASSLFVEQNFQMSSLDSTFQHRVLVPLVENSDDSALQFTF